MEKISTKILAAFILLVATARADSEAANEAALDNLALKFPLYLTGTNKLGQSVFLVEFGKWDTRSELKDEKSAELVDQVYTKIVTTIVQAGQSKGSNGSVFLADSKDLDASQFQDPAAMKFFVKQALKLDAMNKDKTIKLFYVVNANKAYMDLLESIKPSMGPIAELLKVYKENVHEWSPDLLEHLKLDVKKHSGSSGLSPLQVLRDQKCPDESTGTLNLCQ